MQWLVLGREAVFNAEWLVLGREAVFCGRVMVSEREGNSCSDLWVWKKKSICLMAEWLVSEREASSGAVQPQHGWHPVSPHGWWPEATSGEFCLSAWPEFSLTSNVHVMINVLCQSLLLPPACVKQSVYRESTVVLVLWAHLCLGVGVSV